MEAYRVHDQYIQFFIPKVKEMAMTSWPNIEICAVYCVTIFIYVQRHGVARLLSIMKYSAPTELPDNLEFHT
jgi:hypothetical protein